MNISMQCELMAVMTLRLNISVMYFVFASVGQKRLTSHIEKGVMTYCCTDVRPFDFYPVDRVDFWLFIKWRTQHSYLHYLHSTVYASDYVYYVKTVWCLKCLFCLCTGFIKNACTSDMPHKPFYLLILNNHA